jgi:hypothetical protein
MSRRRGELNGCVATYCEDGHAHAILCRALIERNDFVLSRCRAADTLRRLGRKAMMADGGVALDVRLVIRFLLWIWFALGLLIAGLSFWEWWTWRHP